MQFITYNSSYLVTAHFLILVFGACLYLGVLRKHFYILHKYLCYWSWVDYNKNSIVNTTSRIILLSTNTISHFSPHIKVILKVNSWSEWNSTKISTSISTNKKNITLKAVGIFWSLKCCSLFYINWVEFDPRNGVC